MSLSDLCDINDLAIAFGIPFQKALPLYQSSKAFAAQDLTITRRHEGCIGGLEVIV